MYLEDLIEILEKSVAKNGNLPLTTQHLLNICKCANQLTYRKEGPDEGDVPF